MLGCGDPIAISAHLGGDAFDQALALFAEGYADHNERDDQAVWQGVSSGRISAQTGV